MVKVIPGNTVTFKIQSLEGDQKHQVLATVLKVNAGTLTIAEADSRNGVAQVVCHGESDETGTYWYEYQDRDGVGRSWNVSDVFILDGPQIYGSFLE